ncbi:uncharacterized protein [Argopecten irradians]|uniref:uncharacterized protein n=1 Tax=Argopecten irradians TaxID=31199 RepID=UPI003711635B
MMASSKFPLNQVSLSAMSSTPFMFRQKLHETWDSHDVRMEEGATAVSIDIDRNSIDAVFVTSRTEYHIVDVTKKGCLWKLDPRRDDMEIQFPRDSVEDTKTTTIQITDIDAMAKHIKLDQILGNNHGILGISDKVKISHEGHFLKPVRLRLPIEPMQHITEGETPSFRVFYIKDGDIKELETANVKEVKPNLIDVEIDHFCSVVCVKSRQNTRDVDVLAAVKSLYDQDDPRCQILLFAKTEPQRNILLRSEIVNQDERIEKIQEREKEIGMNFLPACTSPTIRLKNMDKVKVSFGSNTAIRFSSTVPRQKNLFIEFDRYNHDNSLSFHVERKTDDRAGDFASLDYDVVSGWTPRHLHRAIFPVPQTKQVETLEHRREGTPRDLAVVGDLPCSSQYSSNRVFSQRSMMCLAKQIPDREYLSLATFLGVPVTQAENLSSTNDTSLKRNHTFRLLEFWLQNVDSSNRLQTLTTTLKEIDQSALAERVEDACNKNEPFGLQKEDGLPIGMIST